MKIKGNPTVEEVIAAMRKLSMKDKEKLLAAINGEIAMYWGMPS